VLRGGQGPCGKGTSGPEKCGPAPPVLCGIPEPEKSRRAVRGRSACHLARGVPPRARAGSTSGGEIPAHPAGHLDRTGEIPRVLGDISSRRVDGLGGEGSSSRLRSASTALNRSAHPRSLPAPSREPGHGPAMGTARPPAHRTPRGIACRRNRGAQCLSSRPDGRDPPGSSGFLRRSSRGARGRGELFSSSLRFNGLEPLRSSSKTPRSPPARRPEKEEGHAPGAERATGRLFDGGERRSPERAEARGAGPLACGARPGALPNRDPGSGARRGLAFFWLLFAL